MSKSKSWKGHYVVFFDEKKFTFTPKSTMTVHHMKCLGRLIFWPEIVYIITKFCKVHIIIVSYNLFVFMAAL